MKMKKILILTGWLLIFLSAAQADEWIHIIGWNGLPEGTVWGIEFYNEEVLIVTEGGGAKLNFNRLHNLHDPSLPKAVTKFLAGIPLFAVIVSPKEEIICGSKDSLYISADNGNTWKAIKDTPAFQKIFEMIYIGDTLWVGDNKAVYSYSQTKGWNVELDQPGEKCFAKSPTGIWIGVYGKGIFFRKYGEKEWRKFDLGDYFVREQGHNAIKDIVFSMGKLWSVVFLVDGASGGVYVYDPNDGREWLDITNDCPNEIAARFFTCLAADSSGQIWFGSSKKPCGVYKLDPRGGWSHFEQQMFCPTVNSIGVDSKNRKWFCHEDAITVLTETSGVETIPGVPTEFQLDQNYPNPFNPTTTIRFTLPKSSPVILKVFDMMGREVASLVDQTLPIGEYEVEFDAKGLASGTYFYRIETEGFIRAKKLTLLK